MRQIFQTKPVALFGSMRQAAPGQSECRFSMLAGDMNKNRSTPFQRRFSARQLNQFGALGLIAYVILSVSAAFSILGPTTHPSRELYPFFTWSLFSSVHEESTEYRITVLALDGQAFEPPADMRRIDAFPAFGDSRSLGFKALQNLGRAISKGAENSDRQRKLFGDRFFGRHDVDYRISRHDYNPLDRWRDGRSGDRVTTIGTFTFRGAS